MRIHESVEVVVRLSVEAARVLTEVLRLLLRVLLEALRMPILYRIDRDIVLQRP